MKKKITKNRELEKQMFIHKNDSIWFTTFIGLTVTSMIASLIIGNKIGKLLFEYLIVIFAFSMRGSLNYLNNNLWRDKNETI
jgi:hypothetical protein|tara:strand:- start:46 stop:291 length:246 start_codon:yes stop_codon:yes gene_type:complete